MSSELMKQMFLIQIDKSVTGPTVHQPKKTDSSEVSVEKCGDGSIVLWACFSSVETSRLQTEQEFHLSRMRPYVAQNRIIFGMPGQKKSLLEQVPDQTLFFFCFFFPWILKMYHFYISHFKTSIADRCEIHYMHSWSSEDEPSLLRTHHDHPQIKIYLIVDWLKC